MSKPPIKWSEIKKRISSLSEREQLALFRDIYELSPETKHFICTKLQTEDEVIHNFGSYYDRALKPFDIHGDLTKEDFLRAKKAIKDFQKASADKDSVVELMLCFVEDGTKFTVEYHRHPTGYLRRSRSVGRILPHINSDPGSQRRI